MLSTTWLEKFKLNNNLMGARSRKSSLAPEDAEGISAATFSSHTPGGTSPLSPDGSPELRSVQSQESLTTDSPDGFGGFRHEPFHSQSATSLNSAFTDNAPSVTFSPQLSDSTSPLFTPDSGTASGAFVPIAPSKTRPILPLSTAANTQRPRSQTMPVIYDQHMSSADLQTPKYIPSAILDSPMEEASDPLYSMDEALHIPQSNDRPQTVTPSDMMRPPPLPAHVQIGNLKRESPTTATSPSPEEAQRALEVVMNFIQRQPNGFLDFQESANIGTLMEKLKLRSNPPRANS